MARQGKIARLPHALREQVNQRLLNGEPARTILAWLNSEPAAMETWAAMFEGIPASPQNLSEWTKGGYAEWIARREHVENIKTLADFAQQVTRSGGDIADGAAAILSGRIVETLELAANYAVTGGSDDAEADPTKGLARMASAIASLRAGSISRRRLDLDEVRLSQNDQVITLAREKFERQTVEKFMKFARTPEIQSILGSGKPKTVQMDLLHKALFGERPDQGGGHVKG